MKLYIFFNNNCLSKNCSSSYAWTRRIYFYNDNTYWNNIKLNYWCSIYSNNRTESEKQQNVKERSFYFSIQIIRVDMWLFLSIWQKFLNEWNIKNDFDSLNINKYSVTNNIFSNNLN